MAVVLEALIVDAENAPSLLAVLPDDAVAVELEAGLVLVPLATKWKGVLDRDGGHLGFEQLTEPLAALAEAASATGPVAYVHLEFFGGMGFQASVIWDRGGVSLGPLFTANHEGDLLTPAYRLISTKDAIQDMAINAALRHLGVRADGQRDEFDTVGLGRQRSTGDWLPRQ
ncbi:MAG: hypothetical protein AAF962_10675 [Actinomycetota bacterium]